MDKYK